MLDCFTHTGSFALNAALAGAESVLAVDASETALRQAIRNAELNGFAYTTETTAGEAQVGCPDVDGRMAQDAQAGKSAIDGKMRRTYRQEIQVWAEQFRRTL